VTAVVYADVEVLVKAWALTTSLAPLLTRTGGGVSIFNAMPSSAPVPALILHRSGGRPRPRKDLPEDAATIQFDCWGQTRAQAGVICRTLVAELESIGRTGGFTDGASDDWLAIAEVTNVFWLPDEQSDTPRYIVDALVITLSA
jgi:hypothetical protein